MEPESRFKQQKVSQNSLNSPMAKHKEGAGEKALTRARLPRSTAFYYPILQLMAAPNWDQQRCPAHSWQAGGDNHVLCLPNK